MTADLCFVDHDAKDSTLCHAMPPRPTCLHRDMGLRGQRLRDETMRITHVRIRRDDRQMIPRALEIRLWETAIPGIDLATMVAWLLGEGERRVKRPVDQSFRIRRLET